MGSYRKTKKSGGDWKFLLGITVVSVVAAFGVAVATQGLPTLMHRLSLAAKAMDDPTKLSADEKIEVKKLIKDKGTAKEYYNSLSSEQQAQLRQQANTMSDAEKEKYRKALGR